MYVISRTRTASGKRAGPTIYELNASGEGRSAREIPRLVATGVAITYRAGRSELITMGVLELLCGIGVVAEVVVGRRVLEAILSTQHTSTGLASVWPSAALLGVITVALGLAGVVLREKQQMLSELTTRYAQDRILDVTCAVDLAAFDQPEFHDRVARAQAGMRAPQMVFGLRGLGRSMAGAIGAGVALLAVAPYLVPVALLALIPGWLANHHRGRAFYHFGVRVMGVDQPGVRCTQDLLAQVPLNGPGQLVFGDARGVGHAGVAEVAGVGDQRSVQVADRSGLRGWAPPARVNSWPKPVI